VFEAKNIKIMQVEELILLTNENKIEKCRQTDIQATLWYLKLPFQLYYKVNI
jgi:hypothetical protein